MSLSLSSFHIDEVAHHVVADKETRAREVDVVVVDAQAALTEMG